MHIFNWKSFFFKPRSFKNDIHWIWPILIKSIPSRCRYTKCENILINITGFWTKIDLVREQPLIKFKHEVIIILDTIKPDGSKGNVIWTTFPGLLNMVPTNYPYIEVRSKATEAWKCLRFTTIDEYKACVNYNPLVERKWLQYGWSFWVLGASNDISIAGRRKSLWSAFFPYFRLLSAGKLNGCVFCNYLNTL